jgi:hypothetical protein
MASEGIMGWEDIIGTSCVQLGNQMEPHRHGMQPWVVLHF